jgi:GAF domain-containing protein
VTPLEPIPETVEAVNELDPSEHAPDLLATLTRLASRAQEVVPDLVGVSIAMLEEGLTFTLAATADEIAVLDGVQYAAGGPCVEGALTNEVHEFNSDDVLDEHRWQLFAEATAAHTVRSTLTLPVVRDGVVEGSVNLYAASRRAFVDHHDELAEIFGAWAAGAIANADLAFTTRSEAQAAPRRVKERAIIDVAVGILAAGLRVDIKTAEDRLRNAAARAGVTLARLATDIVHARQWQERKDR